MSEQNMRQRVNDIIWEFDPISVENPAYPGTPDINYVEGWLELKWLRKWPDKGGIVRIEHFSPQQRVWLTKRARAGGNVFLLLQANGVDWLIFDGITAAKTVGLATKEQLIACALHVWDKDNVKQKLKEFLREQNA